MKILAGLFRVVGLTLLAGAAAAQEVSPWQHADLRGDVYYQVFVRSFADSDGDGIGDLNGLRSRLDYLNDGDPTTGEDLGVDGLWLMPMFESPSYHGYDVVDYLAVDEEYGSLDDFRALLDAAHERGLRVIVDFVMNHTSSEHPWFQASTFPGSPFREWYVWRQDDPGWKQPWGSGPTWHPSPRQDGTFYYGIFWSGMPDLNFAHPPVRRAMARLAEHWLAFGLDGFRLDATRHLFAAGDGELQNGRPETHDFLREFSAGIREKHPRTVLVGENWTDTEKIAPYFGSTEKVAGGDELPMNFNFPLAGAVVDGLRDGSAFSARDVLTEMAELYPAGVIDAPFLRNHDQVRLATALDGHGDKLRSAAAVLLTLPGVPFLYYGEEIALQNGGRESADPLKRLPMPWRDDVPGKGFTTGKPWADFAPGHETGNVKTQAADEASLLHHYRRWIAARKTSPALRFGTLELLDAGGSEVLVFLRRSKNRAVWVAHNFTGEERPVEKPDGLEPEPWIQTKPVTVEDGRLLLPPWGSVVFKVR